MAKKGNPGRVAGVNYNIRISSPPASPAPQAAGRSNGPTMGGQGNNTKLGRGQSVQQVPIQATVEMITDEIVRITFDQAVIVAGNLSLNLQGGVLPKFLSQDVGFDNTFINQTYSASVVGLTWSIKSNAFAIQNKSGGGLASSFGTF